MFSFLYSPFKLVNPTSIDLIHSDISSFHKERQKSKIRKYDEINLTDIESPISIFRVFIGKKILFISPIPILFVLLDHLYYFFCQNIQIFLTY